MNWTESALNRHSRRKGWNEDAARQKQYFAKARARFHQSSIIKVPGAQTSHFIPSYIPQSSLGKDHQQNASKPHLKLKPTPIVTRSHLLQLSSNSGTPPNGQPIMASRPQLGKRNQDSLRDTEGSQENEPPDFEAKRRRLLEKSDWTGVEYQKSLITDYPRQSQSNTRKKVIHQPQTHLVRTISASRQQRSHNHRQVDRPTDQSMRLRIGSQDLRWSRDSNSVRSPVSTKGNLLSLRDWQSQHSTSTSPHPSISASLLTANISSNAPTSARPHRKPARSVTQRPGFDFVRQQIENLHQTACQNHPIVIRSAPKYLHQPSPTRPGTPPWFNLQSPGPDDSASMIAEVGGLPPQLRTNPDDAHWRSWMNTEEGSQDRLTRLGNHHNNPTYITPGIIQG